MSTQKTYNSRYLTDFDHQECIGKGGFGLVFRARHRLLDKVYAVKRITLPNNHSKDNVLKEAKTLAKLEHKNIVRFFSVWMEDPPFGWRLEHDENLIKPFSSGVDSYSVVSLYDKINISNVFQNNGDSQSSYIRSGSNLSTNLTKQFVTNSYTSNVINNCKTYLYIQMEFCEGGSLDEWLLVDSANVNVNLPRNIFKQILEAVSYIHDQNLIHRDIKPANIFFSSSYKIKLGDFGLVTDFPLQNETFKKHSRAGTRTYMSPEQVNRQPYNNTVDIYACGLILFELLVKFKTQSERITMLQKIKQNNFPIEFIQHFPNEHKVLQSMLAKNPMERISAQQAIGRLFKKSQTFVPLSSCNAIKSHLSFTRHTFSTVLNHFFTILVTSGRDITRHLVPSQDGCPVFWLKEKRGRKGANFPSLTEIKDEVDFVANVKLSHVIEYSPTLSQSYFALRKGKCTITKYDTKKGTVEPRLQDKTWFVHMTLSAYCTTDLGFKKALSTDWYFKVNHVCRNRKLGTKLSGSLLNNFSIKTLKGGSVKFKEPASIVNVVVPYKLRLNSNECGGPKGLDIKASNSEFGHPLIALQLPHCMSGYCTD